MKMIHQSAAVAAALCMVVIVLCSSGATARELREGDIFERILGGLELQPKGNGTLRNTPGDVAKGAGAAAGNLTVLGSSAGPKTVVDTPPIVIDIIPPMPSALPPCVAVPPVSGGALPPSLKGALPPVPACIGVPPLPQVPLPAPVPGK